MSITYVVGVWTERDGDDFNSSGQMEHIYCASGPGVPEVCRPDRIISPLGGLYLDTVNAWRSAWGVSSDQIMAESGPGANPWTVTLRTPISPYPFDPTTGDPLPGPGPVGGVGGPWGGGLGGDGPDGGPGPPPPPPRPGDGCNGMTYLVLIGLPVTTATRPHTWVNDRLIPGCNGMEAHAKLWVLQYPENEAGTGLDFSQPPSRYLQWDRPLTPDGTVLWSGSGIQWSLMLELELLPVEVDGVQYEPVRRYHPVPTGCMDVGLPVAYRVQPGPGLLMDPVRVQLTERGGEVAYPPGPVPATGVPYRLGLETAPAVSVTTVWPQAALTDLQGLNRRPVDTVLGRLDRWVPFPDGLSLSGPWPARAALEALIGAMRARPDGAWLGREHLPDLLLRDGDVTVEALDVPAGWTAGQILRAFLEPFAGYTLTGSVWGRVAVQVPPWRAGAPAPLSLTAEDLEGSAPAALDTSGVLNVVTLGGVTRPLADDPLPLEVALSRATYGRRVGFFSPPFTVSAADAGRLAAHALQVRLNPVEVLTLAQAPPYPVRPERVGRWVTTPDGEGVLTGWAYDEQHTPQQSQSSSTFTLSVPHRLVSRTQPLPDGTTLTRTSERRYHRARWGAVRLKE